jgi:hypothetical protein
VNEDSQPTRPAPARTPYELWFGFVASLIPHGLALGLRGYGRIVSLVPLAAAVSIVDVAAVAVAGLQLREDRRDGRASHWLVWATLVAGGVWLLYVLYVGAVYLMVQLFCINQLCRSPLG